MAFQVWLTSTVSPYMMARSIPFPDRALFASNSPAKLAGTAPA